MADIRQQLPIGTELQWKSGCLYRIAGEPVGFGGGSILYPARQLILRDGEWVDDGFLYALKECYPVSGDHRFCRDETGRILPAAPGEAAENYLRRAQQMQLEEGEISRRIYRTASRMLPIRDHTRTVTVTLPGKAPITADNTLTVMESLSEKGRSLHSWLKERRRFPAAETFRILQQLLFSLREVHEAGFLHLDIQDSNVFLRGTLTQEDRSELVTLIDFGSARAMEQGKTAPIRDRVIFTSQGFSAPEILLHNDGTLQLGPEADLYSVGCLALYLLTGHKADPRLLLANNTGIFLKPNELRRIQCPKHLVDRLQKFLAKSLALEPENRYRCAEEMLLEVTDLANALLPYRTDLRSVKYDAFICYRHGELDSPAAAALQRALENFHAPRGVAQSRRPFRRVFVDEGELSSCADFGLQIREALKNSGWLIVVCSPDTPLSPWVQLEIDTFLEYHDRSRILAVLTGGSEKISFPPQLQGGSGAEEVLAADARGETPREVAKKLRGDALLKLAAPMLGTTFDTLKQRQKQYRLQRAAVIAAVFLTAAAAFAAYADNRARVIAEQARQIQEATEDALLHESRFLSEQAEKRLADNDPLGAMALILEALPSEQQDRPVLTETEYLLGKALGIYRTPGAVENTVTALGIIDTECPYFFVSGDGARVFTWEDYLDNGGSLIRCWDADSCRLLWERTLSSGLYANPIQTDSGTLLVQFYDGIGCLDAATGNDLWTREVPDIISLSISADQQALMVISGEQGNYFISEDPETPHRLTADTLSAATGEVLRSVPFQIDGNQYVDRNICVSPELKWAAVPTVDEGHDNEYYFDFNSLFLLDLETGKNHRIMDSQTSVCALTFAEDRLAVIRGGGYTLQTYANAVYEYDAPFTYVLEVYSLPDGQLLWQQESTDYLDMDGTYQILPTGYNDGDVTGSGLLYLVQDQCILVDSETLRTVRHYQLPASAVSLELTEKGFETINADGSCSRTGFTIETVLNIACFREEVSSAVQAGSYIYVQHDPAFQRDYTLRKYQLNKSDAGYTPLFTADSRFWSVYATLSDENGAQAILTNQNQIRLVDLETGKSRLFEIEEDFEFSDYYLLGLSEDCTRLYWRSGSYTDDAACWIQSYRYFVLDLNTGSAKELVQPEKPEEYMNVYDYAFLGDRIVFLSRVETEKQSHLVIYSWDLVNGTLTELHRRTLSPAPEDAVGDAIFLWEEYAFNSFAADPAGDRLYFATYTNNTDILQSLVCLRIPTGEVTEIHPDFVPEPDPARFNQWKPDRHLWNRAGDQAVFFYGNTLYIADSEGGLIWSIPTEETIAAMAYTPDESCLLVVLDSGILMKYHIADKRCVTWLDLSDYMDTYSSIRADYWNWEFLDDDTLLAAANGTGFLMDISGEQLTMKAVIDQCIGYDPWGDRFLVAETYSYSGKGTTVGSFPRYTLEDLIRAASEILSRQAQP